MVVQPEVCFSRWRLPSSWISKNCWNFFSIWPIDTKISGHIETSFWNISMMSEIHIYEIQDGGRRHHKFCETLAIFLLFNQSSPNLVGMLLLWFRIHRWRQKVYVTIIQDGGCRHLGFWKTAAISLLLDEIVTKICENIGTSIWIISMTSEMHSFKNSRWQSPPSWISKNCCHFITYWTIIIKFSRNIAKLT